MSIWKSVRLGDVCRVIPGYAFKSRDWSDTGFPVVKIKNIQADCTVDFTDVDCVPESVITPKLDKFRLHDRDILIAMTGATAGKVGKIRTDSPVYLNQRVAKISPFAADPNFVWAIVSSRRYQELFFKLADGAAQPNMSGSQIEGVELDLPDLPTQHRIASILSAYDDLIENNTRRIAILEEMARRIYEEWFVRFRFPGHEQMKMVESEQGLIPEGWALRKLGEVIELAYGKALKAEERKPGPCPVFGSSGIVGCHEQSLVDGPGIIVGRKGNVGSVHWCDVPFYPIDTVYFVRTNLPLHYVFFNLKRQHFINNDAAVPGLNRNQAYALHFLVPSDDALGRFVELCEPIFKQVRVLTAKNANLRATRDLLLPKLISGELDVSTLPEPEEAIAA